MAKAGRSRRMNGWQQQYKVLRDGQQWPAPLPAKFEELVAKKGLTEDEAADDPETQSWIRKNYVKCFVPEAILTYMGLTITERQLGFIDFGAFRNTRYNYRSHGITGVTQRDSV